MTKDYLKIGIILGSTRIGRRSPQVGDWVKAIADKREDSSYENVDIAEFDLPFLVQTDFNDPRIIAWNQKLDAFDGLYLLSKNITIVLQVH